MEVSTSENLKYCKDLIKMHQYARYLQCHFLRGEEYVRAVAYYALVAELEHIHDHVSEEMIGHIRFAWWNEAVDALPTAREHPVLKLLAASGVEKELLLKLVESYREVYPEMPANAPELPIDNARWNKAGRVISNHRGGKISLLFNLLFS